MKNLDLNTKLQLATVGLLGLACFLLLTICVRGTTHQTWDAAEAQRVADLMAVRDGIRSTPILVNEERLLTPGDDDKFSNAMFRSAKNLTHEIGYIRKTP